MSTPEIRTQALALAVGWARDRAECRRFHPGADAVISVADEFAEYIAEGQTPAPRPSGPKVGTTGGSESISFSNAVVYDPASGHPIPLDEAKARGLLDTSAVPKPGPRPARIAEVGG